MLTYSYMPEMIEVLEEVRDRFFMFVNSIDYIEQDVKPRNWFICCLVEDVYFEGYKGDVPDSVLDNVLSYLSTELDYRSTFQTFVEDVMLADIKRNSNHKVQSLFHIAELKLQWIDYLILKLKTNESSLTFQPE